MPREDTDDDDIWNLGQTINPQDYLANLAGSSFVHTIDSKVFYYECNKTRKDGDYM